MRYFLLGLSILVIVSCKKVDVPKSKQDTLRASQWRLDTATVTFWVEETFAEKGHDTTVCAWGDKLDDCKKDDYLVFRENSDGGLKKGANKCQDGETEEDVIEWGITDNDTKMFIYNAGDMFFGENNVNANLVEFKNDKFKITYKTYVTFTKPFVGVGTKTYTIYMKKK